MKKSMERFTLVLLSVASIGLLMGVKGCLNGEETGVYKGFLFQRNEAVEPSIIDLRVEKFKDNKKLQGEAQFEDFELADVLGRKVLFKCDPEWFDFEGEVHSRKAPFTLDLDLQNECAILDDSGTEVGGGTLFIAVDNATLGLDSDGEYHVLAASQELDVALECTWGDCNEFEEDDFVFFMSRIGDLN